MVSAFYWDSYRRVFISALLSLFHRSFSLDAFDVTTLVPHLAASLPSTVFFVTKHVLTRMNGSFAFQPIDAFQVVVQIVALIYVNLHVFMLVILGHCLLAVLDVVAFVAIWKLMGSSKGTFGFSVGLRCCEGLD